MEEQGREMMEQLSFDLGGTVWQTTTAEFDEDVSHNTNPLRRKAARPGSYIFRTQSGTVLYVGSSKKSMTQRILSHIRGHRRDAFRQRFSCMELNQAIRQHEAEDRPLTIEFVPSRVEDVEDNEAILIQRHRPRFNRDEPWPKRQRLKIA